MYQDRTQDLANKNGVAIMDKKQAGSKGGRATVEKHGRGHMQQIGKRGAAVTWTRYTLKPVNQSQYAMVDRETNIIKAVIGVWKP
jgi:hypothetical protein